MARELLTPSPELLKEIVETHHWFFVGDLKTWVDGTYYEVLREARKRARNTRGIVISVSHRGQWYKVDVAYHSEHAD